MSPHPPVDATRARLSRRLAFAALLLMAVVVVASAWLRLAQARPDCIDWPGCRDALRPALGTAATGPLGRPEALTAVRGVHRLAASTLLLVVATLSWFAWSRRRQEPANAWRALTMLTLALGLAALGIVTPGARSAAVLLGNLLGGLLLLALSWSHWREARASSTPRPSLMPWALAGAVLWLLQAALGAQSGAGTGSFAPVAPVAHLALALFAALSGAAVGVAATRRARAAEGRALVAVALAQLGLGAASAAWGAAPPIVLAHNALAATGLALLLGLALARGR